MVFPEGSCSCITRPVHRGSAWLPGRARHSRGRAQSTTAVLRATIRRVRETDLGTRGALEVSMVAVAAKGQRVRWRCDACCCVPRIDDGPTDGPPGRPAEVGVGGPHAAGGEG